MKKKWQALVALVLVLCVLLTGCSVDFAGFFEQMVGMLLGGFMTEFDQMVYTRPDMENLKKVVEECTAEVPNVKSLNELVMLIYEAYAPLDEFSTAYALSNIHYCKDLTEEYWAEEYAFCSENAAVAQAALDKLYRALAKSSYRKDLETPEYFGEGFFENYEGDSMYDDVFTGLLQREAELENRYYELWDEVGDMDVFSETFHNRYGRLMEDLFVELVAVRQEMATYLGYENYPEFAYDFYYGRDYTWLDTSSYLADIRAELSPMYTDLRQQGVDVQLKPSDEKATLAYVEKMANAMGGTMANAYADMVGFGLYDIGYSENKFAASFEVFITGYYTPYIFMNPTLTQRDQLTLAHEFGHFCADYANVGSAAGIDVAEVFSQSMEYLSLLYVEDTEALATIKMVDSLGVFVEQSAYASFEQQVYLLEGEEVTKENIRKIYAETIKDFAGVQLEGWMYVPVTHFFTSPMYVISYVVSNDVALQIYQMEQAEAGKGLATMEEAFLTMESGIVAFAEDYGLESPFAEGRIAKIKDLFRNALQ